MRARVRRILIAGLIALVLVTPAAARGSEKAVARDRLAYVSGGKLYAGSPGAAHLVPGPGTAFQPAFSHDGRWLAFLRQRWQGYVVSSHLWLARGDGSGAHVVMGAGNVDTFAWSPSADVLAVRSISTTGGQTPVRLVPTQGSPHSVAYDLQGPFLWSPDGRTLAIAAPSRGQYTRLDLVRGSTVTSYAVPGVGRDDPFSPAAWWPDGHGILLWLDPGGCSSCIADGTKLVDFNLHTRQARQVAVTLPYHRDWLALSGARLLVVTGRDRSAFFGKHLRLCFAAGACEPLPAGNGSTISLDPAWAPSGGRMAFVVAPAWDTEGFQSPARYWSWMEAHVLWIARPDGSGARPAAAVPKGAQAPQWTRDGRGILFVKGGALWIDADLRTAGAHPVARLVPFRSIPYIQAPVSQKAAFQNWYYGYMDWHDLFAWY